jgi:hypothetical protein
VKQRLQLPVGGDAPGAWNGLGITHDREGLRLNHQVGPRGKQIVRKVVAIDAKTG